MKLEVSTHKLFGYRSTLRTAKRLADEAVRVVNRAVAGRMPDVQVVLTGERDLAEVATAAEWETAGCTDKRVQARSLRAAKRLARDTAGRAIPLADGGVLIVVNVDQHPNEAVFALTLVHELVHAMQMSRKGVRDRLIAGLRHDLGVERMSRRLSREHDRLTEAEEKEAYGSEYLAGRLVPSAAA
uniref:TIGR04338 family metallohydrolase n=1 Tax=Streptomyces sp. NBC_01401 TaxID=2903854 RepID=A0AAU3GVQ7_9ACTN